MQTKALTRSGKPFIQNNMEKKEAEDKLLTEARRIAESKVPKTLDEYPEMKEVWLLGFVAGYLSRLTEEIKWNN